MLFMKLSDELRSSAQPFRVWANERIRRVQLDRNEQPKHLAVNLEI